MNIWRCRRRATSYDTDSRNAKNVALQRSAASIGGKWPEPSKRLHVGAAAGVAVALQDAADLPHHRLRREDLLAGPARDRAELPERADLPGRAVGHDDVVAAVGPQDRRLGIEADDPGPVAVLARQRVEDPARAGREARPVLRRRGVAGVAVVAGDGLEDLGQQHLLALLRLAVARRPVGGAQHVAAARRRPRRSGRRRPGGRRTPARPRRRPCRPSRGSTACRRRGCRRSRRARRGR